MTILSTSRLRAAGRSLLLGSLMAAPLGFTSNEAAAQVPPPPAAFVGTWQGTLDAGAVKLRLVFHVAAAEDGTLSGTMDSPDQGAGGIPASSVSAEGRTLRFALAPLGALFEATLSDDGQTLEGTFSQGGARLPLAVVRVEGAPPLPERPQHPSPPFPYRVEEVTVRNLEAGVTLAGTLTLPQGPGPFPGAVLVSGSGPQDRDETLMGHKPFLVLADHLTRHGIAVLRYDDRGVAGSTGDFPSATSEDFTSDALAAVAHLAAHPDVGPVGIVGHSEGGLVGPLAAVRSPTVQYVVMLAGPGLPGGEIVKLQGALIARAEGTPEEVVAHNVRTQERLFQAVLDHPDPEEAAPVLLAILEGAVAELPAEVREAAAASASPEALAAQVRQVNSPWFRFFLRHDPRPVLEQVRVPVLALFGELDLQVPAEVNEREAGDALRRGGNPDATLRTLPRLNHLFQTAGTGSPTEYATITETMSPLALDAVSSWIRERFPAGS